MFLGRRMRIPLSLLNPVQNPVRGKSNARMEAQFNLRYGAKAREFQVGDQVWAEMPNYRSKEDRWHRGTIMNRKGQVLYWVLVGKRAIVRHVNQLRRAEVASDDP